MQPNKLLFLCCIVALGLGLTVKHGFPPGILRHDRRRKPAHQPQRPRRPVRSPSPYAYGKLAPQGC